MSYRAITTLLLAALTPLLPAQTPQFDAASIKPSQSAGDRKTMTSDPGRLTYTNVTLLDCLMAAYDAKDYQISGPGWLSTDHFNIIATAPNAPPDDAMKQMLRQLLTTRFQMTIHREKKDLPVYAMVVGKSGTKLHETENPGRSSVKITGGGAVAFSSVTISELIDYMSRLHTAEMDRPVIDDTGLKGRYDITIRLFGTQEEMTAALSKGDFGTSIFTLIQEQLGLKLEPRKLPLDMIVVDRAERIPTQN